MANNTIITTSSCGSRRFIPDTNFSHPGSASKNLIIFTQNIASKLSEIRSEVVRPGSGFFTHPRYRIRNTDY